MPLRESEAGLRQLDKNIVRMLKIMTHEVRGPLVSVMAGMKVVLHGSYGAMEVGVSDKLQELHAHLNRLLGNFDDFLGKACCLEGAFHTRHEQLHLVDDVLAVVLDELSSELRGKRILVQQRFEELPDGKVVVASRLGMLLVFRNLLRNAVRFGGTGCTIACGYKNLPDHHRLNVYNSGTPVPDDRRERLFTKFCTLDDHPEPNNAGIGLGLYLTREIVRAQGGEVWYEPRPDGSNFVFTIPKMPSSFPCDGTSFEI